MVEEAQQQVHERWRREATTAVLLCCRHHRSRLYRSLTLPN